MRAPSPAVAHEEFARAVDRAEMDYVAILRRMTPSELYEAQSIALAMDEGNCWSAEFEVRDRVIRLINLEAQRRGLPW